MKIDKSVLSVIVSGSLLTVIPLLEMPARAAEQIILEYDQWDIELPLSELQSPGWGGQLLNIMPPLNGNDRQVIQGAQLLLGQKVKVPLLIDQFLESSTGQFALQILDGIILSQKSDLQTNLSDLKTAISIASADNQISLIELLQAYPQNQVKLNVVQLASTVDDVKNFVQRSQPAFSMARNILADLVCDCNATSTLPGAESTISMTCNQPTEQALSDSDTAMKIHAKGK